MLVSMRTATLLLVLAACLCRSWKTVQEPMHPKEYWSGIVGNGYAVPEGADAFELLGDLFLNLGSPDSVLRDDYGYGITAEWVLRRRLLETDELLSLVDRLVVNLEEGIGEAGGDSVLLRSFSALNLSVFATRDLRQPFLTPADFEALLDAGLTYLANERDLRGFDSERGWMHSAAHTADLLRSLGRNPQLDVSGAERIFAGVARRLTTAGIVFTHGEDERLAQALLAILVRDDFELDQLNRFIELLQQGHAQPPGTATFDPIRHSARQNGVNLLRVLFVALSQQPGLPERLLAAQKLILTVLAGF